MSQTTEQKNKTQSEDGTSCLVIGGGGFLGRHLVEELLERKWKVRVFDIKQTFEDYNVEFFVGDLCDKKVLINAMEGNVLVLKYFVGF